jgi:hypothetical protein
MVFLSFKGGEEEKTKETIKNKQINLGFLAVRIQMDHGCQTSDTWFHRLRKSRSILLQHCAKRMEVGRGQVAISPIGDGLVEMVFILCD